ncbi:MAG TPA: MFS transporter [Nocardioidaceae bacterium]|jgi:MFS family permease|nr:MFS transporter [Nocardioidaceae bacterium]
MTEVAAPTSGVLNGARSAVRETAASLGAVFANPNLRKVQLALAGSMIGDWAYSTAVAVWAYQVGGAKVVGIWAAVRLTLLALGSPFGAMIADRVPRRTVMVTADLARAVLVVAAAACLFLDLHPATVFVLATVASLVSTAFRPAQQALMPSLANRPEELTASNGATSTLESLAVFVGPAIGALLIGVTSVPVVFLVNAATFLWSMLLVLGIRVPAAAPADPTAPESSGAEPGPGPGAIAEPAAEEQKPGFLSEVSAGFRLIVKDRDLLVVTAVCSAQTVVAGASAVFMVVMAVSILGTGPSGVGYLDSVTGVGAIVGGFYAISRASRRSLAQDMTAGVVLWSLPLVLVAAWASPVTAFVAAALLGFGNPLVDVNLFTIVQRLVPDEVLGRVFGALETCLIAGMALGSAVMPFLIGGIGLRSALAVIGVLVAVLAVAGLRRMRRLDRRLGRPDGLPLLRAIPMFAPLAPPVLEALANQLVQVPVTAGDVVLREGEDSDRFYVIESGLVEVTQNGAALRQEGPGDFFGEIGLLRDVPRTATITAAEHTTLLALEREAFLAAVTGQRESRLAADEVITRRLTV